MALHELAQTIDPAGSVRFDRFIVQMPLDVQGEVVGRLVPPRAVFFQRLHHDPVQVTTDQVNQVEGFGPAMPGRGRLLLGFQRAQPRRGRGRFLFADDAPNLVQAGREKPLCVERRLAGQQFVEQHAQTVDVAARIDVQPAHFRLLRAHVSRRADELFEGGEDRFVGQRLPAVALAMPKSITFGTGSPSCMRHQDVRGLDVAMDDAFLVRVLDRRWQTWMNNSSRCASWRVDSGRSNR